MTTKSKTISLKNAAQIFPNKYTKIRSHDLISKSVDYKKLLTKKEQEKMQNLAVEIRRGLFGHDYPNQDMLATRNGRKIKIESLFD